MKRRSSSLSWIEVVAFLGERSPKKRSASFPRKGRYAVNSSTYTADVAPGIWGKRQSYRYFPAIFPIERENVAKKAFSHYFPRSRVPRRLISRIFPQSPRQIPHTPARSHCLSNSARHSLFLCKSWQSILTRLTFLFLHATSY